MSEPSLVPESPYVVLAKLKEIGNFANDEDITLNEKIMVLEALEADYTIVPTEVNQTISQFIENVVLVLREEQENEQ